MTSPAMRFEIAVQTGLACLALGLAPSLAYPAATDLNDIPMAVSNQVKANMLVVLDNSQSMDAYMGGALQSGNDPNTRGNLGRQVLRSVLGTYRSTFNWGLMSFDAPDPLWRYTHVFYMGDDFGMVFTDDCVDGKSASNGQRRCVAIPAAQSFSGGKYVTYDLSSDDPSILDVLYDTESHDSIWGISPAGSGVGSTTYDLWFTHTPSSGTAWAVSEFANHWFTGAFTPTDSGFLASYPTVTRQFYLPRGWGYRAGITGGGKLLEDVSPDSAAHYAKLIAYLGAETSSENTVEIKNAALFTPVAGTLDSVRNYFSGQADWKSRLGYTSPIAAYCQQNFVMLLTDGLPTGDKNGALYSEADRSDSCSAWNSQMTSCTGTWTFGQAATDALDAVKALGEVPYTGCTNCNSLFDVQTYVIAMGDTVSNARAVALMNQMALDGGTEKAFFASDPVALQNAIESAVSNAVSKSGAAASVAVANANVTEQTASFQSSYNSENWTGDLKSYKLDQATGTPLTSLPSEWQPNSAQKQLDALALSRRKIVSYDGTDRGIQFQPTTAGTATALSAAQETLLSATDGPGVVNYIRGDRTGEASGAAQKYRHRDHLLADIVNSEPVFVAGPVPNYNEGSDPGYAAFKSAHAARQAMVFQGANDGMLHAFNAESGAEAWAYVPNLILPTLGKFSLWHGFSHKYYVDGTPTVGDVDFVRTGGGASSASSNDWHSILVGGLGKGGHGYYALDITRGVPVDEAAATANVLWEFPNSSTAGQVVANLGYSFGKPVISKTTDQGWVVLVTSGYNNIDTVNVGGVDYVGDGVGHLFVLNAKTGALIRDIATGAGSTASPSGLASFSAYLDNADIDNTASQVYGGDLYGNVWRFDLTGPSAGWNVRKLATLVDASGKAQPVTTAPELAAIVERSITYRFVYVGTGQYLGDSDVSTTAVQTMYGLVDDLSTNPTIYPLRSSLQQQLLSGPASGTDKRIATSETLNLTGSSRKKGWYIDLPASGERVSTDPQLAFGTLVFTSNVPSSVKCEPGGESFLNLLDYRTGGALAAESLGWSSVSLGKALASRPLLVRLPSGKLRALIRMSDGRTITEAVPAPSATPAIRRVSWRELQDASR